MAAIGTIFSDTFSRADSAAVGNNWVEEGSVNAEILNGKLRMVGSSKLTHRVRQAILTGGENFTILMRFQMASLGASSWGPVVGTMVRVSEIASGAQRGYCAQVSCATGEFFGKVIIHRWDGAAFNSLAISAGAIPHTAGDVVELSISVNKYELTGTARNITQGGAEVTISFTMNDTTGPNFIPGPRDPAIWIVGGTCDVSEFTFSNQATTGGRYIFIGDSITHGSSAGGEANRWQSLVAAGLPGRTCWGYGAAGSVTANVITEIAEILLYSPDRAMLMIGGNDILIGISSGTWQANYQSIVASLEGAGIQVWHCLPTPRDSTDVSGLKNWINATYGGAGRVIDSWTPLNDSGTSLNEAYDSGDNVHPNGDGHALIASTVLDAILSAPIITSQPSDATKIAGQSVMFTAPHTDVDPIPTYQWRKDGVNIGGATSASYEIASVTTDDAGDYDCVVTNSEGSATSDEATLTVNSASAAITNSRLHLGLGLGL